MFRKISTKLGRSNKDEVNGINGTRKVTTNGTESNGTYSNGISTTATGNERPKHEKHRSSFAFTSSKKPGKDAPDHSASRSDVESSFAQFAQVIHASQGPLPTQSGNGADMDHKESSGLMSDVKALGFKDVHTLIDVMKNKATGALQDDKTYLMEKTIQVKPLSDKSREPF